MAAGEVATPITTIESGMESVAAIPINMQPCVNAIDSEMRRGKKTRRQQNAPLDEVNNAVQVITARDTVCPLARVSEPTRLLHEVLAEVPLEASNVPFEEVVSRTSCGVRMQLLQPGLGEPAQSTSDAVSLLLHQSNTVATRWRRARRVRYEQGVSACTRTPRNGKQTARR